MKQEWNTPISAKQFWDLSASDMEFCEMVLVNTNNIKDSYKDSCCFNPCNIITNIVNYAANTGQRSAMNILDMLHDFSLYKHSVHFKWIPYSEYDAASNEYDTVSYNTSTDTVLIYKFNKEE